jgi:hypothetical protein
MKSRLALVAVVVGFALVVLGGAVIGSCVGSVLILRSMGTGKFGITYSPNQ